MSADARPILFAFVALAGLAAVAGCIDGGEGLEPARDDSVEEPNGTEASDPAPSSDDGSASGENATAHDEEQGDEAPNSTTAGQANTSTTADSPSDTHYDPGWPPIEEAEIRPGAAIGTAPGLFGEAGGWNCTTNFIFSTPDNRTLYVGTAAHCFENNGIDVGDPVDIADGAAEGTLVYSSFETAERHGYEDAGPTELNDLALVHIPQDARGLVHPAVRHFGGPTGLAENPEPGTKVLSYGNTWFREPHPGTSSISHEIDPHEGYLVEEYPWVYHVRLDRTQVFGDSGSPMIAHEGEAMGVMKAVRGFNDSVPDDGLPGGMIVTKLPHAVPWAENHTDLKLELKTWPVIEDGELPDQSPSALGPSLATGPDS